MPLLPPAQYVHNREGYAYADPDVIFTIIQTGGLTHVGQFGGIFPAGVPIRNPLGLNLRKFERICQEVFSQAAAAHAANNLTQGHIDNIRSISTAIVHWKMASQGGRANRNVANVLNKWEANTHLDLLLAYQNRSLDNFKIGGVRIPTASAFLRFLDPQNYGIVDRRVVSNHTQPAGLTEFNLRLNDSYINDVRQNVQVYSNQYVPFLVEEANWLNNQDTVFQDIDENGLAIACPFRPCDVEMALF